MPVVGETHLIFWWRNAPLIIVDLFPAAEYNISWNEGVVGGSIIFDSNTSFCLLHQGFTGLLCEAKLDNSRAAVCNAVNYVFRIAENNFSVRLL